MTRHRALTILGLNLYASDADIRTAWRAKAKLFHPDSPYADARAFMMAKQAFDALREKPKQHLEKRRRVRVAAGSRRT